MDKQQNELASDAYQAERASEEELNVIYQTFTSMRDEWIEHRARSGIETLWRKWERLYDGTYEEDIDANPFVEALKTGPAPRRREANRSRVVINIVRPKVDQSIARHCEILLPTDDKNWGIRPTPSPELAEIADDKGAPHVDAQTGQPQHQVASELIELAKKSCEGMQREIDDALSECNYNGQSREVIQAGVKLGTGIMKGPFPVNRTSKKWTMKDGAAILEIRNDIRPASAAVSCWNIFPDKQCGNDIHRGRGIYERAMVNRKEIRALIGVPGYDEVAIRRVLKQEPMKVKVSEGKKVQKTAAEDGMYEMWTYHGEIEPDDALKLTQSQEEPLDVEAGMIVIINDIIIGALESIAPGYSIPYDFWQYREQEDSPWGIGLPEEQEHQQRVATSAWRQLMDNAAAAAGYHIVVKKGLVNPVGQRQGDYSLSSRMVWEASEDVDDVRTAFSVTTIDMRAQELLAIVDAAMKFSDQESSMPQLLGGEKGTAPETVGGMQILQANAQGPLRFRVKRYDDSITKGQIGRHYDWQMEYSEKNEIKGDFQVDARGATVLLERDVQAQSLLNVVAITADPRFAPHFEDRKLLEQILRAARIDPGDVTRPVEEVENEQANAQQPPDPRIVAAQLTLQGKQLDVQDRKEQRQADLQMQGAELAVKREGLAYNVERERAEGQQNMIDAQLEREIALTKLQHDGQLQDAKMATEERLKLLELDNKNALFNAEAALRVRTGEGI